MSPFTNERKQFALSFFLSFFLPLLSIFIVATNKYFLSFSIFSPTIRFKASLKASFTKKFRARTCSSRRRSHNKLSLSSSSFVAEKKSAAPVVTS
jgi:hypothetical protein